MRTQLIQGLLNGDAAKDERMRSALLLLQDSDAPRRPGREEDLVEVDDTV